MQLFFHAQQFLRFFFFNGRNRNAGPAADNFFDVLTVDDTGGRLVKMIFLAQAAEVFPLFPLFVGIETRLLKFMVGNRIFHAMHDELDPFLDFRNVFRQRSLAQLYARAGFVEQVNRFVRQEAVRNIAVGVIDRILDRVVGVAHGMELLVALLDAVNNLDRFLFTGRRNFYRLEAALEGAVFFNGLAIFAGRGGADALDLTARKRWLKNIGCIQRAFSGTGPDQGVQLIDKDDAVLIFHQFFHDGFEALFKLSAIFRAGHDQ